MSSSYHKGTVYKKLGLITLFFLFGLILIGGIVRTTGAGMGCPDWPQCFGMWIPPTNVSQLPENYQEIYKDHGYASMEFNAVRTWTEYINRLFGALTGLFILATLIASFPYLKRDSTVFYLSLAAFLMVCFEGWLGAKVVASNLAPKMVTIHLLVAFLIVATLIYALLRAYHLPPNSLSNTGSGQYKTIQLIAIPAIVVTLVQVIIGTFVRQEVTELTHLLPSAESWLVQSAATLPLHRSLAWLVIATNGLLIYMIIKKFGWKGEIIWAAVGVCLVTAAQILTGILLTYFGFPPAAQALHILLAAMLFGFQIWILGIASLAIRYNEVERKSLKFEFSLK
ncbi:MAG: COX15/CtaA family protein [Bacteroidia bacterium]